jgi:hypothetical protein
VPIWQAVVTEHPRSAAEDVAPRWGRTAGQMMASPYFLLGSVAAIVDILEATCPRRTALRAPFRSV